MLTYQLQVSDGRTEQVLMDDTGFPMEYATFSAARTHAREKMQLVADLVKVFNQHVTPGNTVLRHIVVQQWTVVDSTGNRTIIKLQTN